MTAPSLLGVTQKTQNAAMCSDGVSTHRFGDFTDDLERGLRLADVNCAMRPHRLVSRQVFTSEWTASVSPCFDEDGKK